MKYRVKVEIEYFIALAELPLPQLKSVTKDRYEDLRAIYTQFNSEDALAIELALGQEFGFAKLAEEKGIRQALFFGVSPKQAMLNLNAQKYQPFKVGGISFLFSDELPAIQSQPNLKRPLWEALKTIFGK